MTTDKLKELTRYRPRLVRGVWDVVFELTGYENILTQLNSLPTYIRKEVCKYKDYDCKENLHDMMAKHLRPEFIEHYKLWETFGSIVFPQAPEDYQHKKRVFKKWNETQPGRWN